MVNLIQELIDDLTVELQATDENFNASLLEVKVKNAVTEVKNARNYPSGYDEQKVSDDMIKYYSQIRNIALFDYNTIGGEFQKASSENSTSRTWVDRDSLFNGIISIAKL